MELNPPITRNSLEVLLKPEGGNILSVGSKVFLVATTICNAIQLERERASIEIFNEKKPFITLHLNPWPFPYAWSVNENFSMGDGTIATTIGRAG